MTVEKCENARLCYFRSPHSWSHETLPLFVSDYTDFIYFRQLETIFSCNNSRNLIKLAENLISKAFYHDRKSRRLKLFPWLNVQDFYWARCEREKSYRCKLLAEKFPLRMRPCEAITSHRKFAALPGTSRRRVAIELFALGISCSPNYRP